MIKHYLFTICLLAAFSFGFVACDDDEEVAEESQETSSDDDDDTVYPTPEAGTVYYLQGTVLTDGFGWSTNSIIGLYSAMDDLKIINKQCPIVGYANTDPIYDDEGNNTNDYTPSEYEGESIAVFTTPELDLVAGKNSFMIYYPYDASLTYTNNTIYGLSIDDSQTQSVPNVTAECFSFGTCVGIPGVDDYFEFELTPVTALAEVKISSTELVGYAPYKVTIYDDSGSTIAGGFNVNLETLEFTQVGDALDRVSVTVTNPVALTSSSEQSLYMNILPIDFSDQELWIVVELEDADGAVLTIPVQMSGLSFTAGETTEIDLTGLSTDMNAASDWYVATETRLLTNAVGVAYGEANTYFIQCKTGSTYNGATYSANDEIPDEVTIDYRARGNFSNAVKPEGVTFEWFSLSSGSTYLTRTSGYDSSNVDPSAFTISVNEADMTVTVKNTGAYAGSPILVMKKDDVILWAWAFWNVAADGTTIDPVTVGSYQVLPMDIGQATTQYDTWIANSDPVFRTTFYYQWGRYAPVFWNSYWSLDVPSLGLTGNVPSREGPMSFEDCLEEPIGLIVDYSSYPTGIDLPNWSSDYYGDLWGGNLTADPTDDGIKSIYDPCPKGYRVCSPNVFDYIESLSASAVNNTTTYRVGWSVGDLYLVNQGYVNAKLNDKDNRPNSMGGGSTGSSSVCSYGLLWSNYLGADSSTQPRGLSYRLSTSADVTYPSVHSYYRSVAAAVRCMVDEDNR